MEESPENLNFENALEIHKAPTSKHKIWQRKLMVAKIIPHHPSVLIVCATQGGGKSTLITNMLTNPLMYGPSAEIDPDEKPRLKGSGRVEPYFKHIFIFHGSKDDMYDPLIEAGLIEKKWVHPKPQDIQDVIDQQTSNIDEAGGDLSKVPRILVIFDDLAGDDRLMRSKSFKDLFFGERHLNCSTWFLSQYLNAIPKRARLQANGIIQYHPSYAEIQVLLDEARPYEITIPVFMQMIKTATEKDEKNPEKRNFLYIVKGQPVERRYRKNFDMLLQPPLKY